MNPLHRLSRFTLVGILGAAVQLTTLAVLHRLIPHHDLLAATAALEITLLHNFLWHRRYTWPESTSSTPTQLLRFHLANGLVSCAGNLVLTAWLLHHTHLPLVADNLLAILGCSAANFTLANHWTFTRKGTTTMRVAGISLCLLLGVQIHAQTSPDAPSPLSTAPTPTASTTSSFKLTPSLSYLVHTGVLCGMGASTSAISTKPATGCGAGITLVPYPLFIEVGVMAPQANRSYLTGYLSLDTNIPLARPATRYLPMILFGYSRLFETGHALDYGLALALPRPGKPKNNGESLRLELRDYWTFANPTQHNIMLRIGWMQDEPD